MWVSCICWSVHLSGTGSTACRKSSTKSSHLCLSILYWIQDIVFFLRYELMSRLSGSVFCSGFFIRCRFPYFFFFNTVFYNDIIFSCLSFLVPGVFFSQTLFPCSVCISSVYICPLLQISVLSLSLYLHLPSMFYIESTLTLFTSKSDVWLEQSSLFFLHYVHLISFQMFIFQINPW